MVEGLPPPVQQRPLTTPFRVPDGDLLVEIAEAGEGLQIDAGTGGSVPHGQKRRDDFIMQRTTRGFERNDVRAGAARYLEFVHCSASYRL